MPDQNSRKINLLRNITAAVFITLFALYIGITLTFQYRAFKELNRTSDYQTQKDLEKRAVSLSYFLDDRMNDLNEISTSRELTTYYENKALGMSLQYGLKSSLAEIEDKLFNYTKNKTYENKPIYSKILLIDNQNKCIVDTHEKDLGNKINCDVSGVSVTDPGIISDKNDFVFKTNIFFKNRYEGKLYAWIKKDFLKQNFILNHINNKTFGILISDNGMVISTSQNNQKLINLVKENLHIFKKNLEEKNFSGQKINIYKKGVIKYFGANLKNLDYCLFEIIEDPNKHEQSPIFLISAMTILLFAAVSGLVFWWRLNSINFSLKIRVNEQIARKEAIKEKNKELQREVIKRRAAERTLAEYTKNLERIIQKKTENLEKTLKRLKIAQSQLVQSEKMASIGQLSAGIAHEINNPLGFIKTNLSSIKQYGLDALTLISFYEKLENASSQKDFNTIKQEIKKVKDDIDFQFIKDDFNSVFDETGEGIERILSIISDLKFFSHRELSEMSKTDLHQCINSTLNVIHNEVKYKAEIIKDFSNIPMIMCYPQRINQILTNLIINAAQAIKDKGKIFIKTYVEEEYAVIKICDTGPGIPDELKDKIFDPFFSTKPVGKGTGLGLHVVYNLIKKHNGKIKIENQKNGGACFYIHIPVRGVALENSKNLENS